MICKACNEDCIQDGSPMPIGGICAKCYQNYRKYQMKDMAIAYAGGKCTKCGYNKSVASLCFHHLDPSTKEFTIGSKYNLKWERIKNEIDKCILLCHNCHDELHFTSSRETRVAIVLKCINENKNRTRVTHKSNGHCINCGTFIPKTCKRCMKCSRLAQRKVRWPTAQCLQDLMNNGVSNVKIGKMFGVSDGSVAKWQKKYGIYKRKHKANTTRSHT